MNLKIKRIIILLLDILISILIGCSFFKVNEIQNIDVKFVLILIALIITRITFDFSTETVEEKSYKLDQEIILLKKQHEIDRFRSLNQKALEALSKGNTKDFIELESMIGR